MDLDKALRAMNYSEPWRNSVNAAALFEKREYTEELLAAMTKKFLGDLVLNEHGEVLVPNSIGNDLLQAVKEYEPEEIDKTTVERLEEQIENLREDLRETKNTLDTTNTDLNEARTKLSTLTNTVNAIQDSGPTFGIDGPALSIND